MPDKDGGAGTIFFVAFQISIFLLFLRPFNAIVINLLTKAKLYKLERTFFFKKWMQENIEEKVSHFSRWIGPILISRQESLKKEKNNFTNWKWKKKKENEWTNEWMKVWKYLNECRSGFVKIFWWMNVNRKILERMKKKIAWNNKVMNENMKRLVWIIKIFWRIKERIKIGK